MRPLRAAAFLVSALAVLLTPALLFAHARLVRSTPSAGATLTAAPTSLDLWFSERPELKFTKITLADSAGASVELFAIASIAGDAMGITVPISGTLKNGRYTVSWRTAAADGHPTTGTFSFVLDAPPADSVAAGSQAQSVPIADGHSLVTAGGPTTFSTSARWAELVAVLTLVGCVVFALIILPDAQLSAEAITEASDRARRLGMAVLILFIITALWRLSAEAALMATPAMSRVSAMADVTVSTRWGQAWLLGASGALVAALGLAIARRAVAGWVAAALGVVAICFGEALTGHSGALTQRAALATSVDLIHVLGAGAWLGGLICVLLAGLPAMRGYGGPERRSAGQRLVRAYHQSAIQSVGLVLLSAAGAVWLRMPALSDLWTTTYGRILLLKIALVLVVLGFGWFHWRTVVTASWSDDTAFRFKRSATFELLVGAAVLAATAVLVSTALPGAS